MKLTQMKLTKKDRIFLINQYEIRKRLDPGQAEYCENIIEILQHGYETFYSEMDEWVADGMSVEKQTFIIDILNIYRAIENYKDGNPNDTEIYEHHLSTFGGFDGNNETEYLLFTQFIITRMGRFVEQQRYVDKTDNFNSHMPMIDNYRDMVRKWIELGKPLRMSRENILAILNA